MGRKNRRRKEYIRRLPEMTSIVTPKRMEVWIARLPMDWSTSVQGGTRPVLIVSNDAANRRSPVVTVIPMTTRLKHLGQPTHVVLKCEDGTESMLLGEQITTIAKKMLCSRVGRCEDTQTIRRVEAAIREQTGMSNSDTS